MVRGVSSSSLLWACLPPPLVGPLLKLWRSQGNVSKNWKGLSRGLLIWYAPSSWWHRVTCLVNFHDAWWLRQSLDPPFSPPKNLALQAPASPPYTYYMCSETFPWWGRRGSASGRLLRIFPDGWFGGARFVAMCFVNFRNFHNSAEYGVACAGLSQLSCFY